MTKAWLQLLELFLSFFPTFRNNYTINTFLNIIFCLVPRREPALCSVSQSESGPGITKMGKKESSGLLPVGQDARNYYPTNQPFNWIAYDKCTNRLTL